MNIWERERERERENNKRTDRFFGPFASSKAQWWWLWWPYIQEKWRCRWGYHQYYSNRCYSIFVLVDITDLIYSSGVEHRYTDKQDLVNNSNYRYKSMYFCFNWVNWQCQLCKILWLTLKKLVFVDMLIWAPKSKWWTVFAYHFSFGSFKATT